LRANDAGHVSAMPVQVIVGASDTAANPSGNVQIGMVDIDAGIDDGDIHIHSPGPVSRNGAAQLAIDTRNPSGDGLCFDNLNLTSVAWDGDNPVGLDRNDAWITLYSSEQGIRDGCRKTYQGMLVNEAYANPVGAGEIRSSSEWI
jgi:hypothetical protein